MVKRVRPRPARIAARKAVPLDGHPVASANPAPPLVTWPAAPPSPPAPAPDAVGLFQDAMQALQRKQYRDAAQRFETLLDRFAAERALADRARVYLDLCERELARRPPNPQTIEERLTAATAALNNDQDHEAERLARAVLGDVPDQDLALYLLAAVEARRSAVPQALDLLSRAIALSPEASQQARYDPDFDVLHDSEEFWRMTDKHAAADEGLRRARSRRER